MRGLLAAVRPSAEEVARSLPGDEVVPTAGRTAVTMDRAFDVDRPPEDVWPWLLQLGKGRAGWYLPRSVERALPRSRRGARRVSPQWQALAVGDRIPDYGPGGYFEVARLEPPYVLVYRSRRGRTHLSWAITLRPGARPGATRVHLRLRLAPVRRVRLAEHVGGAFDALTIAGMAGGLRERLDEGSEGSEGPQGSEGSAS